MTILEREITEPVDLCLPTGRLNPDAVGWTRRPLHRSNLRRGPRRWGRNKRWEYWGVVSPTHIISITVSSLDFIGVHGIYVLDRQTGVEIDHGHVQPLARGVRLPERSGEGSVHVRAPNLSIEIDQQADGTTIYASAPDVDLELLVPLHPDHESLGVVVPWNSRQFQYTVKDVGRPAVGTLHLSYQEHPIPLDSSFAVLDHGRGRWPHAITWNWGVASGVDSGRHVALQIGGTWTDGTGSTENALIVDGVIHKISEELTWTYDRDHWKRPWTISGERVQATFVPFHERVSKTRFAILSSETHQCFCSVQGWASTDDGRRVSLDGLVGWVEEAQQRW